MEDGPIRCARPECDKPAGRLQCPTCLKEGKPAAASSFCSQDCFKTFWSVHKLTHSFQAPYDPWPNYRFTGPLRPAPYGPRRTVPDHIPRPDYADDGIPHSEMDYGRSNTMLVLTPEEAEQMRIVCRMGREILDAAARAIRPGVTTDDLDAVVHEETIKRNAYPSTLNYSGFPRSCCTSVNEVICHGIPDRRPLVEGDIVNIDVTAYHGGFHGDLNETYVVGQTDEASLRLVNCARDALAAAIAVVRPGTPYREVGNVIEKLTKARGFSVVKTYCGHGIHRLFHTVPSVPHYARSKAVGVMKAGHVFTIEPMINAGSWQDDRWPDEWTAVTVDGKRSAQFEHTLLVTEDGCEVLTGPLPDSPAAPRL